MRDPYFYKWHGMVKNSIFNKKRLSSFTRIYRLIGFIENSKTLYRNILRKKLGTTALLLIQLT